jgi:hypothetical protein
MSFTKRLRGMAVVTVAMAAGAIVLLACGASSNAASTVSGGRSPSATSTTSGHFKIGQQVKVGDTWIVTVNSFKTLPGDDITAPKSGDEFVGADVTVKNVSGSSQTLSSVLNFTFRDSTGQSYDETIVDNAPNAPDGEVDNGGQIRGTLAYEVPTSQKSFTLTFQADITSSGGAVWDLSL